MGRFPVLLILAIAVHASALSGQSASTALPAVEIGYDSHATTLWSAAEQRGWPSGFDAERTFDKPQERLAATWRARILQYEQTQPRRGRGG